MTTGHKNGKYNGGPPLKSPSNVPRILKLIKVGFNHVTLEGRVEAYTILKAVSLYLYCLDTIKCMATSMKIIDIFSGSNEHL